MAKTENSLWDDIQKQLDSIETLPLVDILDSIDEFMQGLPGEYYPPALHFQVKRHLSLQKDNNTNWDVEKLLGEIAAILVRLEHDRPDDALYMAQQIVGDTYWHGKAFEEYQEEIKEE